MVNKEYKNPKGIFFSVILLSFLNLSGCNDKSYESNLDTLPPLPEMDTAIFAENNNQQGLLNSEVIIDIKDHIRAPVGSRIELKNVTLKNNSGCKINSTQRHSFSVQTGDVDDCLFEYEVVSQLDAKLNATTAIARLAVGETYQNEELPRITKQTILNKPITIDLTYELLNEGIDSEDNLDAELTIIGSGEANIVRDNIVVFEPSNLGTAEVFYSYKSASNVKQGIISVSVSEEGENTPPTVTDFEQEGLINLEDTVVIDVSGYVEDINGDDIQLVSIDDFNSSSSLFAPTDINNTQFYFNASVPGSHDVAYTVSDHMGGYSTGIVHINVEPDFSLIQDWEDIVVYDPIIDSDIRFFSPMTKVYADYVNANYTGTVIENGSFGENGSEIVTMTLEQARGYCKVRGGRLPLTRELNTLFTTEGNLYDEHNWPTTQNYWTADKVSEQDASTLYMHNGVLSSADKDNVSYVTCVDLSNKSINDFSTTVTVKESEGVNYIYDVKVYGPDGENAKFSDIGFTSSNSYGIFNNQLSIYNTVANLDGVSEVQYTDISFNDEVVIINVSSNDDYYSFSPDFSKSVINVNSNEPWSSKQWNEGSHFYGASSSGIYVQADTDSNLGHLWKAPFVGEHFLAYYKFTQNSVNPIGAVSFFIHQEGDDINNLNSPEGDVDLVPSNSSILGFQTSYYSQGYYLLEGGSRADFFPDELSSGVVYVWFEYRNNYFFIYTSKDSIKPAEPIGYMRGEYIESIIDLKENYWITLTGANYGSAQSLVNTLYFATY